MPDLRERDGYWASAARNFKDVRMLAICAMFIAMHVVVGMVFIPVGDDQLRIMFDYAVVALGAAVYGPLMAIVEGLASDLLGYFLAPTGGYFPGYTLSSMLGSLVYALFFYRQKASLWRIFLCRLSINLFINVLLGTLWRSMITGKGYLFYLSKAAIKNAILLPVEVAVMAVVFRLMVPVLRRMRFIKGER